MLRGRAVYPGSNLQREATVVGWGRGGWKECLISSDMANSGAALQLYKKLHLVLPGLKIDRPPSLPWGRGNGLYPFHTHKVVAKILSLSSIKQRVGRRGPLRAKGEQAEQK